MPFNDAQRQWVQALIAGGAGAQAAGGDQVCREPDDDATPLLAGEGAAAGRDGFVNGQVDRLRGIAENHPATDFKGDVYRSVPSEPGRIGTYADHSFSRGGRYNKMGDPALYTSPSVADVQAEARNYGSAADPTGIEGNTVVRSEFEGQLLDARNMPDVSPSALEEPWGMKGQKRSLLSQVTGEDPYTMPRAVSDVAQGRNLGGILAPANEGHTNIPLFPEKAPPGTPGGALHDNLAYKGQQEVRGGVVQPETVSTAIKPNIPDATPNRNAKPTLVAEDAGLHGRAGGARYGAAGGAVVSLGEVLMDGEFDAEDAKTVATHTAGGAAIGQADSMLAARLAKGLAGAGAGEAQLAKLRPTAGLASAGVIGAAVGGGMAAWNDAEKVQDGSMSAGQATADVAVSAGVGLGAGMAGAAAGAAVGSIVPIAGTAVGAVVGFGVGMAASVVATLVAEKSGVADAAREELGEVLTEYVEQPLQGVWKAGSDASAAVQSAAGAAADAVSDAAGSAVDAAASAVSGVEDSIKNALGLPR